MVQKARSNAWAEYQTTLRQEQSLAGELEAIKKQAIDQSSSAVQFTNLKVEIETRRELLDELMRQPVRDRGGGAPAGHARVEHPHHRPRPGARRPVPALAAQGPDLRPALRPAARHRRGAPHRVPRPHGQDAGGGGAPARPRHPRGHPGHRRRRQDLWLLRLRLWLRLRRSAHRRAAAGAPARRRPRRRRRPAAGWRRRRGRREGRRRSSSCPTSGRAR